MSTGIRLLLSFANEERTKGLPIGGGEGINWEGKLIGVYGIKLLGYRIYDL